MEKSGYCIKNDGKYAMSELMFSTFKSVQSLEKKYQEVVKDSPKEH